MPRKEKLIGALKGLKILHFRISHSSLLTVSILSIALFIAFMVRLLPLRWGYYLSEFDPYFHYRSAEYLVENGYAAWDSWVDYMRWHPFGNPIAFVSYRGLAMTTASLYVVLRALGLSITLFQLHIIFPVIMGTLTSLVIYFFAKDIGGKEAGLFAALFLALNASYIGRTSLGFADDEAVGIFALLLFSFFFLRSIEKERALRSNLIYAVAAGLSLGYMSISWGASRYPIVMTAVFVFILILLRRYSSRLLLSYGVTFSITFFIAVNVPNPGFGFLTETFNLSVVGVFLLLCLCELFRRVQSPKTKVILISSFFVLAIIAFFLMGELGFFGATPAKFISVINPLLRAANPIFESVAEHRPGAWASLYYEYGIGAFFIPVGLFFMLQNPTNRNIFLSVYTLTTIYFASSMIRLTLLMAPAFCILWAVALVWILRPFVTVMKEAPVIPRRKMRFGAHVGKEFSAAFIMIMLILLIFPFYMPELRPFKHAYSPATIAAASAPIRPGETVTDWLDTLEWMRVNLPSTAVVCSWWDYGYWITILGNQTTLADNGTINTTQIGTIGLMFVSNETEAIKILKTYDVTHVVVFTTFSVQGGQVVEQGWGDEGKWHWMIRIAGSVYPQLGLNELDLGNWTQQGGWEWNDRGRDTVIYKLMRYGAETRAYRMGALATPSTISLEHFREAYLSRADPGRTRGVFVLVAVYKVVY